MNEKLPPADLHLEATILMECIETIEGLCHINEELLASDGDAFPGWWSESHTFAMNKAIDFAANRARASAEVLEFQTRERGNRDEQ